ncbi:MAG: ferrochelatase [Actinomycetia bacterium]|nr:ferrochelatase [Actinomycetes bacterium]
MPLRTQAALDRAGWSLVDTTVVFSAHSLPERILRWRDPYPAQLLETARLVAQGLGAPSWTFAYQSEGRGGEPWLGPSVAATIGRLAGEGVRRILVCPIGFVADHLEILYDLDIECRRVAESRGVELRRTESLNDDPAFIDALADVVRREWAEPAAVR